MSDDRLHAVTPAPGGALDVVLRSAPPARRPALTALFGFHLSLQSHLERAREPAVRAAQLQWWREELQRLEAGEARHPATRALAPAMQRHGLAVTYLEEMLDGQAMAFAPRSFTDDGELDLYCQRVGASLGLLMAEICGFEHHRSARYAQMTAQAAQRAHWLADLGRGIGQGLVRLPKKALEDAGLRPDQLMRRQTTPALAALLRRYDSQTRELLQRAASHLDRRDRRAQTPARVLHALTEALLEELGRDGYRVLEHRLDLTPLRRIWIAWKVRRS